MPTVYRLVPDLDNYQYIMADDVEAAMRCQYDGNSISHEWEPPTVYRGNPQKPTPDIWGTLSFATLLGLSVHAANRLCKFTDQSCEILPLELDGTSMFLCNVTSVVSALDQENSRHKDGLPFWIDQYAFHSNRFEYSLFKIPETARGEVLCVEGLEDPGDEFKGAVEKYGLTGLLFKRLWSSSE